MLILMVARGVNSLLLPHWPAWMVMISLQNYYHDAVPEY